MPSLLLITLNLLYIKSNYYNIELGHNLKKKT